MTRDRNDKIVTPEETRRHRGGSQPEGGGFTPQPSPEPQTTQPRTEGDD
jgi:hypothetical protein